MRIIIDSIMVRDQHLNTRVSPEAYKVLLMRCSDQGCTPYRYLRQLVHADVGLGPEGEVVKSPLEVQEPVQTELKVENERDDESRISIVG